MPPTSRKRKDAPQSSTLLNFFGSTSPQVNLKKSKRSKDKNAKANTPEAIIVIDSDSDEEPQRCARILKEEDDSSDVEVIGLVSPKLGGRNSSRRAVVGLIKKDLNIDNSPKGSKAKGPSKSVPTPANVNKGTALLRAGSPCPSENIFSPSPPLLSHRWHSDSAAKSTTGALRASTSGPSVSRNDLPHSSYKNESSKLVAPLFLSDETEVDDFVEDPHGQDLPFDYGVNWDAAMGDDEMYDLDLNDSMTLDNCGVGTMKTLSETPAIDRVAAPSNEHPHVCPVCEKSFAGTYQTKFQEHVNSCLDIINDNSLPIKTESKIEPRNPITPPTPSRASSSKLCLGSVVNAALDNAFSFIMSSHTDRSVWKEADAHEDRSFKARKANGGRRKAPFYKVLQGMPIAVDAFRYGNIPGVTAYFLTHAHSDHYTNLGSNWKSGPIYCSETTANLVIHMLSVDKQWVHGLPNDQPVEIPNTGGVKVTLIEANHCPGSSLFLFEGPQTVNAGDSTYKSSFVGSSRTFRYLHCGDFRACPQHVLHPAVRGKKLDHVYLDTTYLDPKYCFPPQPLVISACVELAKRIVSGENVMTSAAKEGANGAGSLMLRNWVTVDDKGKGKQKVQAEQRSGGKILVVIGTYSIGKERVVKAVAKALDTKIYCDSRKAAILRCESDPELHAMLTNDPYTAGVHIVPLGQVASDQIQTYMERWQGRFSKVVAFRPTGWTYVPPAGTDQSPSVQYVISRDQKRIFTYANLKPMKNSTPNCMCFGVPYSEHSSFFELSCFALSLDWVKMIATVNVGSEQSRAKIAKWVERWEAERRRRRKDMIDGPSGIVQYRQVDYW